MRDGDKPLVWLAGEVKTPPFSAAARLEAGVLLRQLQAGIRVGMPHSRPMPEIGPRCHELRIPDGDRTWRIFYRLDPDAVVLLDVLAKKTRKSPTSVIRVCQQRLKLYEAIRRWRQE